MNVRKIVALSLPQVPAYSAKLTEGVVDRHLSCRDLTIVEVPRFTPGVSPFSEVPAEVDGLIVWAEARDGWVHDFVARGVPVGGELEYVDAGTIARAMLDRRAT